MIFHESLLEDLLDQLAKVPLPLFLPVLTFAFSLIVISFPVSLARDFASTGTAPDLASFLVSTVSR